MEFYASVAELTRNRNNRTKISRFEFNSRETLPRFIGGINQEEI